MASFDERDQEFPESADRGYGRRSRCGLRDSASCGDRGRPDETPATITAGITCDKNDVAGILMRNRRARLQNCRANHPELPSLSGDCGPRAGVDAGEAGQMANVVRGPNGDIPRSDCCQGLAGEDCVGVKGMRVSGWQPCAATEAQSSAAWSRDRPRRSR